MIKTLTRSVTAALLICASSQAIAQSSGWMVSEVSGPVFVDRDGKRVAARRGATVEVGDTIATGARARAVLVHQNDFVTVASNSRVRIPKESKNSSITQFFQEIGNAIFRVEKKGTPHFKVDTPYLAAVVKGTTFSVTVGAEGSSLQVTEGLVEVSTLDGGARDLVRPGDVAMISAGDKYRLSISGDQSIVIDSPARPAAQNEEKEQVEVEPVTIQAPASRDVEKGSQADLRSTSTPVKSGGGQRCLLSLQRL